MHEDPISSIRIKIDHFLPVISFSPLSRNTRKVGMRKRDSVQENWARVRLYSFKIEGRTVVLMVDIYQSIRATMVMSTTK
jgi:hypothetical protein